MNSRTKADTDGLRGVRTKTSHRRIGSRQQLSRSTLERWLLKPTPNPSSSEAMVEDDPRSPRGGSHDGHSAISDSDEDTQPLSPQDLDCSGLAPALSLDSESQHGLHAGSSETREVASGSTSSGCFLKAKITDFFSGASSAGSRREKHDKRCEKQDTTDEEDETML